ncbi:hypothetical protein RRG08_005178 [Elysia crispata]|uniref:Uncharacterized protein n=1 Tax=Elysia crispata TaxID=231223 RepID=A0AAE1DG28_9GAST|nr:hypothetical protein RRG08_005178 [Elysia crispata]
MPAVACPIPGCEFVTDNLDAAIGATAAAKVDRVKRPVISAAGTSEEWEYFLSRWLDYIDATKLNGRDKVLQLLECCDEPLRKDLT